MQSYDTALKILLRNTRGLALRELTGGAQIAKWLNVELPAMQNLRVDLLGETIAGELIQIELQSSNDLQMALRMAEYCLAIYRIFGKFPRQLLLYVGKPEMRMGGALESAALQFRYELVDVRALDGRKLLDSSESVDVVLSVLTKFAGERESVHRIVSKLTSYPELERKDALQQLFTLAGLRTLEENIEEEVNRMPIDIDIREHRIIGPPLEEEDRRIVRKLIRKRFGLIPDWAESRIAGARYRDLDNFMDRLLDPGTIEEILAID